MNNASITIKTVSSDDKNSDTLEFYTDGTFRKTQNGYKIAYTEKLNSQPSDFGFIEIETGNEGIVSVSRKADVDSDPASVLVIEEGRKHDCFYGTEYGDFTVGISGAKIQNSLSAEGGRLLLDYSVDINSGFLNRNEISISVNL